MKTTISLVLLLLLAALSAWSQVAVIANKSVGEASLTPGQYLDIYLLNTRTWNSGQAIELMCLRDNSVVEKKFYEFLHRTPLEMRKVWLRAQLSGQTRPPTMFSSQEDLVKRVETTPGALGFVEASRVQGDVKVLFIIE